MKVYHDGWYWNLKIIVMGDNILLYVHYESKSALTVTIFINSYYALYKFYKVGTNGEVKKWKLRGKKKLSAKLFLECLRQSKDESINTSRWKDGLKPRLERSAIL